ncbi:ParA family protein [Phocaeicola vulgatus]|nr:ParA family protein [Phocaeicola vulgatus]
MMKKEKELLVAIASQKGGVGKSVFTVLLASVLHYRKGMRVAVVDCDSPQHSIALMRERDMEGVMKNDDLKVNLYRQYERIRKPAYPVIKSDPEKAMEDLRRYMDEKGETFDIVLFDLPGTLRSEGVVHTVSAMDYIFVPLKADNIVMQSSLQFAKVLEEELIAKGNCILKGLRLFWNMVDRRGRKDLYDAWNRVIHRMGLRLLSSHIPNTLRYNREADTVCKGVFRSTLFPPDPRQEKGSGLPELVEEICPAIGLEESDTDR